MPDNTRGSVGIISNEVRFAVVMYGGVSLAIYINGVAKELLQLVRSTTLNDGRANPNPSATERVYRKLSYLLAGQCDNVADAETHLKGNRAGATRFVIDIISGTSAGGINGIFLAKALANAQDIKKLEQLW